MGTKSRSRPGATPPAKPNKSYGGGQGGAAPGAPCPDRFAAGLDAYATAITPLGAQVSIHQTSTGDFIVTHEELGQIGRLAGLDGWRQRCLARNRYTGVITKGGQNGPEVELTQITD